MNTIKEMTIQEIQNELGYKIKIVDEKDKVRLKDIKEGDTFKVGNLEFIMLEHSSETSAVILKEFWKTSKFDSKSNNYAVSSIRKDLNDDFYNSLSGLVGKDNIIKHTVDLTSDDGRIQYAKCFDFVSLLTCSQYRRYVEILDKYNPKKWWWLATAYSTLSSYSSLVRCVYYYGTLYFNYCYLNCGVRPFCILKSNIFVSK